MKIEPLLPVPRYIRVVQPIALAVVSALSSFWLDASLLQPEASAAA